MSDTFAIGSGPYDRRLWLPFDPDVGLPDPPEYDEPIENVRRHVAKIVGKVIVRRKSERWHVKVRSLFDADEKRRVKQAASPWPSYWDDPLFDTPFELRRLRILNAIFLAAAKCGGTPYFRNKEATEFGLTVHQVDISLQLVPTNPKTKPHIYGKRPDTPADERLTLTVPESHRSNTDRLSWRDDEQGTLETKVTEVTVELIVLAEIYHRERQQRHYEWLVERKADYERREREAEIAALEAERRRKERFEKAKLDMLLGHARDYERARTIRDFVSKIELEQSCEMNEATLAWRDLALAEADKIDPTLADRFLDVMQLRLEDFSGEP